MAVEVNNWSGNVRSRPEVVVDAEHAEEIVAILRDRERYPNPVRAVGSGFSTTPCGAADGGTLIVMRRMDRVVEVGEGTVTVEAGALGCDVARELRAHGQQFFVNPEVGNLTMGGAAVGGGLETSLPGELGQPAAYLASMKLITAGGDRLEITESDADLMRAARSSLGLLGIVYEATFKVRPLAPLRVVYRQLTLDELARELPALKQGGDALSLYADPYADSILVELCRYGEAAATVKLTDAPWPLRSSLLRGRAPGLARLVERLPAPPVRRFLGGLSGRLVARAATTLIKGEHSAAPARQIRYPDVARGRQPMASPWAFPEESCVETLRRYRAFCLEHEKQHGCVPNLFAECRFLAADQRALLSCSFDGPAMTLAPASTAGPGWEDFLRAYNELAAGLNGMPVLDQTLLLTRAQVEGAFRDRLAGFEEIRRRHDPADRLLNPYFRELVAQPAPALEASPAA